MFVVRFIRKDGQPNEEYYYHELDNAKRHLALFYEDNSDLYKIVLLLDEERGIIVDSVSFSLGSWSRLRLGYLQDYQPEEYERMKKMGELDEHLRIIEQSAQQMFEATVKKLEVSGIEMSQTSIALFAEEYTLNNIIFK